MAEAGPAQALPRYLAPQRRPLQPSASLGALSPRTPSEPRPPQAPRPLGSGTAGTRSTRSLRLPQQRGLVRGQAGNVAFSSSPVLRSAISSSSSAATLPRTGSVRFAMPEGNAAASARSSRVMQQCQKPHPPLGSSRGSTATIGGPVEAEPAPLPGPSSDLPQRNPFDSSNPVAMLTPTSRKSLCRALRTAGSLTNYRPLRDLWTERDDLVRERVLAGNLVSAGDLHWEKLRKGYHEIALGGNVHPREFRVMFGVAGSMYTQVFDLMFRALDRDSTGLLAESDILLGTTMLQHASPRDQLASMFSRDGGDHALDQDTLKERLCRVLLGGTKLIMTLLMVKEDHLGSCGSRSADIETLKDIPDSALPIGEADIASLVAGVFTDCAGRHGGTVTWSQFQHWVLRTEQFADLLVLLLNGFSLVGDQDAASIIPDPGVSSGDAASSTVRSVSTRHASERMASFCASARRQNGRNGAGRRTGSASGRRKSHATGSGTANGGSGGKGIGNSGSGGDSAGSGQGTSGIGDGRSSTEISSAKLDLMLSMLTSPSQGLMMPISRPVNSTIWTVDLARSTFGAAPFVDMELLQVIDLFTNGASNGRLEQSAMPRVFQYACWSNEELLSLVFRMFDVDACEHVDLGQFLRGMSVLLRGTTEQKLQLLFYAHDTNKTGVVSKNVLIDMMSSMVIGCSRVLRQEYRQGLPIHVTQVVVASIQDEIDDVWARNRMERFDGLTYHEFRRWLGTASVFTVFLDMFTMPWLPGTGIDTIFASDADPMFA